MKTDQDTKKSRVLADLTRLSTSLQSIAMQKMRPDHKLAANMALIEDWQRVRAELATLDFGALTGTVNAASARLDSALLKLKEASNVSPPAAQ